MVGEAEVGVSGIQFGEQRFDEVIEVIDLLELATAVLVEFAVARQNVQFLEQFDGLSRLDFGKGCGGG